jgi:uncharacterized membrane protein (DUF4010 family)
MIENLDPTLESYVRLALAFGIGLMVGIERGWRARDQADGTRPAGLRTFTMIGLFGGIAATFPSDMVLIAGFVGTTVLVAVSYVTRLSIDPDRSITSEVAALATFALGALAVRGDIVLAAALGAVLVAVLASREWMHAAIKRVEQAELKAAIQLLVISVVVLPVLPNRGFGPGDVLNPFELWWVVVVVAGISFTATAAVKFLGPRAGLLWTGLIGGFASSTAVAVSCARLAKESPSLAPILSASVGAATTVKFLRTGFVAAIIYPAGFWVIAPSLGAAALATLAVTIWTIPRSGAQSAGSANLTLKSSSDLTVPLSFAVILGVVTLGVHFGSQLFGDLGVLIVSALSGLVDVDAITVSTARQAAAGSSSLVMAQAVGVALAVNTLAKVAYVAAIAERSMARSFALIAAASLLGLGVGLVLA